MRMLALTCIPIIGLSGCAMMPKPAEPVAYQAPAVVAKPAPVAKKAAVTPKRVVRKPVVQPAQASNERTERSDSGGGGGGGDGAENPW